MIKKILLILFVLASYTASAQWTIINGNQRFAKGLGIPTKDTFNTYTLADTSQIVLRPQDSSLYVHYKGRWQKIGGGGSGSVGTLQQVTDLGNTTTNAINIYSDLYNGIGSFNKLHLVEKNTDFYDSAYIDFNTPDYGSSNGTTNIKIKQENASVDIGINSENSGSGINYDPYMNIYDPINSRQHGFNSRGFFIFTPNKVTQFENDYFYFTQQSPNFQFYLKPLYNEGTRFHTLYTSKFDTTQVVDTIATLRDVRKGGGSGTIIDTTSLSNRINLKLDSLKRSSDSVYGYKNGARYFQFKDSVGTNPAPSGYYGAFSDTLSQSVPNSTTAAPMYFRLTDTSNGVSMQGGNRIVFAHTGIYNIQFSVQLQNADNQLHDVRIWLKKNGTDIVGSTGFVSVPNSHGSENGHTLPSWNFVLGMVAGDSLVWYWTATNTSVTIQKYPIGSNPTSPSTASTVLTITQQAGIMAGTGITAINGLTSEAQTFSVDSSNSTFKITSTGSIHKFNIPNASASGVTRGLISNTDYTTFNSKLSASDTANMLLPYLRKIDTANLQSKTLAAYSFQANKTNVNATATANTFKDTTGSYTGTPTWTGGQAPTGITNAVFSYTQIGKLVTLRITMIYSSAGNASNTRVQIPLTSNMPTPATPSGYTSTSDIICFGSGFFGNSASNYTTISGITYLRGTSTGTEIVVDRTAGQGKYVWATVTYFTN
jgi:hypothetical protein